MQPSKRHQAILDRLKTVGACSYQELARLLNVSEMTIRRDADELLERGDVIKVLGGVQNARGPAHFYESPVYQRLPECLAEKEQIAGEALKQIQPGQTIFLDGSTTCLVLARHIAKTCRGLTIVTHSALACLEFAQGTENTVVSFGGQFDPASACFVGATAEDAARRFYPEMAFFSTKGFLADEGTFESVIATLRIKQILAEQAARVVLLVDHSKFGQRALCKVLPIEQINDVITDAGTSASDRELLEQHGVTVRIAPGADHSSPIVAHTS